MRIFLSVFGLAASLFTGGFAVGRETAFQTLSAQQSGIRAVFDAWYADEMNRQGGPGQSHGWWPWGLRAFDYDQDGDLDLLASHHGIPHSIVLKSLFKETGEHRYVNATPELGLDSRDLPGADDRPWIWDFDGDGWLDIAGFSDESRPPSVWNHGGKQFVSSGKQFFNLAHPREIVDLNGDGYLDLDGGRLGQWLYDPESKTFAHDKTPRFPVPAEVPSELLGQFENQRKLPQNRFMHVEYLTHDTVGYDTLGYAPRPIDLNGDGRPDLVVRGSGGYGADYLGRYLLRMEDGRLIDSTKELGLPLDAAPIVIDDFTGNGRVDLMLVEKGTGGVYVQDESGKFRRVENALTNFLQRRGPYLIRAFKADFNNNGLPDFVLSNPRLGQVALFENQGEGDFKQILAASGWDSNPIVIADFNHDGRMDIAVGGVPSGAPGDDRKFSITLYLNQTQQAGNYLQVSPRAAAPNPYAVGAVIEVFAPGELDSTTPAALFVEKAHADGTPIHVGLGNLTACDIRVQGLDGKVTTVRNVKANQRHDLHVTGPAQRDNGRRED